MPEFPGVQPLQEAWDEISRLNDTITELKAGAVQDYLHIKRLESGIQNAETFHNLQSENTILKGQLIQQKINEDATIGNQIRLAITTNSYKRRTATASWETH